MRSSIWILCFAWDVLISKVTAQEDLPSGSDWNDPSPARFVVTSSERRRPRPSSRYDEQNYGDNGNSGNSGDRGSRGFSGPKYPDYFRIEVELQRFDNPQGILAHGQTCDSFNACDSRISAYLDVVQPMSPWPGAVPVSKWRTVQENDNINSFGIGKVVTRDMCGGSLNMINLRVKVVDRDDTSADDLIGQFECLYDVTPDDVAPTTMSASWSRPTQCKPTAGIPDSIRLSSRMRMYTIPRTSCRASA